MRSRVMCQRYGAPPGKMRPGENRAGRADRSVDAGDGGGRRRTSHGVSGPIVVLTALALAGCAIGPDFHPPAAPENAGYAPGAPPAETTSAPVANGASQRLVSGRDIPGEWWRLFRSRRLNSLIE